AGLVTTSCVVTGAAKGLGLEVARRLIAAGHVVVGLDRDGDPLQAAADACGLVPVHGSITAWADHERAAATARAAGPLAGWVNNAAIDLQGGAHEVDAAHIAGGLEVLCAGPMMGMAVAVRTMLPDGGGSIVNVSSIQAVATFPRYYVYGAAKAAACSASPSRSRPTTT
ncbi:MAG: SDR family oxidoreductase, partial [Actinomycetota bacterium]